MAILKVTYLNNFYSDASMWFLQAKHNMSNGTNFDYLNSEGFPLLKWPIRTENCWPPNIEIERCRSHRYNYGSVCGFGHGPEGAYVELANNGVVFTHHALMNGHLATAPYLVRGFSSALMHSYRNVGATFAGHRFKIVYDGHTGKGYHGDLYCKRIADGITAAESINERYPHHLSHP